MSHKKTKWIVLIVLLVALLTVGATLLAQALWDSDDAVHIVAGDIEDSTIIIGTHLIHLSALTDDLYEIALTSAEDSGQMNMYYKSEMAEGAWFDITSARTLADISGAGSPVDNSLIEALFFEYHTKSDGVTYDLRTGEAICVFDIVDPYDVSALPELEPLKNQYDLLCEKEDKNDVEDWCEKHMRELFSIDFTMETATYEDDLTGEDVFVDGAELNDLDDELAQLQWFLDTQNQREMDSDHTGVTMDVMSAVDAERRLIIMRILNEKTFELQQVWMGNSTITARPEDYVVSVELTDAVSSSLDNISESTYTHLNYVLSEGTTTISAQEYFWKSKLIDDSLVEMQDDCDYDVEQLLALASLLSGDGSLTSDSADLISEMVEDMYGDLVETLSTGENVDYTTAVVNGETDTYLDSLTDTYESTISQMLAEVFYLQESLAETMSTDDATAYLSDCIADMGDLYNAVADDDFANAAYNALDAFLDQLTTKLTDIVQADGSSEIDLLTVEKEDLQTEYMSCLDDGDLDGAAEIMELIEAIDDKIDELLSSQVDAYASAVANLSALEDALATTTDPLEIEVLNNQIAAANAEVASLESQMSAGTVALQVIELRDDALAAIGEGDAGTVAACLSALDSLMDANYSLVFPAVVEIYEDLLEDQELSGFSNSYSAGYLDGSSGAEAGTSGESPSEGVYIFDDAIAQVEEIILSNTGAYEAAMAKKVTTDDVLEAVATVMELDPDGLDWDGLMVGLDDEGDATVLAGLAEYLAVQANPDLEALAISLANQAYLAGNPLVYLRVDDIVTEYLPLDTLSYVTGLRYYWNNSKSAGVLAKGSQYYAFSMFYDVVALSELGGETVKMSKPSDFRQFIHVPEDFTAEYFACQCAYLKNTEYGVAVPDSIRDQVDALVEMLFQGGF